MTDEMLTKDEIDETQTHDRTHSPSESSRPAILHSEARIDSAISSAPPSVELRKGSSTPFSEAELLNSDAQFYGGSRQGNGGGAQASNMKWHHRPFSLALTLPPLGALFLQYRD